MSRGISFIRASAVRVFNLVLSIAIGFFMMPYLVEKLGDRMYGLWTLIGSLLGYYGLMDFGLSPAIGRYLSRAVGSRDDEEYRKVLATSFYIFCGLSAAAIVLTFSLAFLMDHWVRDPRELGLFRFLLMLLGMNFALDFPVRSYNAVFSAKIRDDIQYSISIVKSIASTAFVVFALERGYGILGLASVVVIFSLLDSATRIYLSYRIEPKVTVDPRYFDRGKVKELFSYSTFTFLGKIADMLRFQTDSLIITAFIGLSSVTHYFIAVRLVDYLSNFIQQMLGSMGAIFSQDEGRNDYESIRNKLMFLTRISLYVSVFFGGFAMLYGHDFILRWMGAEYLDAYPVLLVLFTAFLTMLIQQPATELLFAIGKHKVAASLNICEGIANLLLGMYLVQRLDILGVAIGLAIPMLIISIFVRPWIVCRVTGLSPTAYARLIVGHTLLAALYLSIGWVLAHPLHAPTYTSLVACAGIHAAVYWPLAGWSGLSRVERQKLWQYAQAALPFLRGGDAREGSAA